VWFVGASKGSCWLSYAAAESGRQVCWVIANAPNPCPPPPFVPSSKHRDRGEDEEEEQQRRLGPAGTFMLGAVT
jgi:hypothetical protein